MFITSSKCSSNSSSINFQNRSFEDNIHHQHSNDHQVIEFTFTDDGKLYIFRAENSDPGFGMKQFDCLFYSVELS
jgi:hypothetical protein